MSYGTTNSHIRLIALWSRSVRINRMASRLSQKPAGNNSDSRATAGVYSHGLRSVLALFAFTFTGTAHAIFSSEYVEGSANNKALEIFNESSLAFNLDANLVEVRLFANGSMTATSTISLSGMIASGDVFVLAHSSAVQGIVNVADELSASLTFNGDDAIDLYANGIRLDLIGQVGIDPGTEWGSGVNSTQDNTLRRRASISSGNPGGAAFNPAVEWDGYSNDTIVGLGSRNLTGYNYPVGDFNLSFGVDAADYVIWRKSNNLAADYNRWRTHFGEGSVGGLATQRTSAPEASSITLLVIGMAICFSRRCNR
jgi:hypothetical protein